MKVQRWFCLIWLLAWLWCGAIGCATPSAAPKTSQAVAAGEAVSAPDILQDILVVDRDVHLIFALSDSARRPYSVFEASDPFRVIVALPNTMSENVPTPMAVGGEIVKVIETKTVAYGPHPYTKVVIELNYETAYRIRRAGQELAVGFDPAPTPSLGLSAGPAAEPGEAHSLEGKSEETTPAKGESSPQLPSEPPAASAAGPEAKETLVPAVRLLAIQQRSADQGVQFRLVCNGSLSDYDAFHLLDPPRVVVDLFGVRASEVRKEMPLNDSLLRKVRVGIHDGNVRVVFDVIPPAGVPYKVETEAGQLTVTFSPGFGFPPR